MSRIGRPDPSGDDPAWSEDERRLVSYLRSEAGGRHRVGPGGRSTAGDRLFDATVDGVPTEFKTPDLGADSATLRNRVADSARRGGQARHLVFDVKRSQMPEAEARRGAARIRGAYSRYYDRVRVVGADFDVTEEV